MAPECDRSSSRTASTKPIPCRRTAPAKRIIQANVQRPGTITTGTGVATTGASVSGPALRSARPWRHCLRPRRRLSVAGNPYYYAERGLLRTARRAVSVVAPPQGAVVGTPPASCSSVNLGNGVTGLDCGGAFYDPVAARLPGNLAADRCDDMDVAEWRGRSERQRRYLLFLRRGLLSTLLQRQQRLLRGRPQPVVRATEVSRPLGSIPN